MQHLAGTLANIAIVFAAHQFLQSADHLRVQRLRIMPEDKRNALLNSEAFKNRYSASEFQMLTDISQNYPIPGR